MGNQASWRLWVRNEILREQEYCRNCKLVSKLLTFDHILPKSLGGNLTLRNTTILCVDCQHEKGNQIWPWQVSLWDEGYRPPFPRVPRSERPRPKPQQKRAKKKQAPRKVCEPGCWCSSCTFWRTTYLFDLDGLPAADRKGALS